MNLNLTQSVQYLQVGKMHFNITVSSMHVDCRCRYIVIIFLASLVASSIHLLIICLTTNYNVKIASESN